MLGMSKIHASSQTTDPTRMNHVNALFIHVVIDVADGRKGNNPPV